MMTINIWWVFLCGAGFMMGLIMGIEGQPFGWIQATLLLALALKKSREITEPKEQPATKEAKR